MTYPMTTSLQVEAHDAWLAEMQKEPSPGTGTTARSAGRAHPLARFGAWLISNGQRLETGAGALTANDQASAV
jgi:hypothetical protein